MHRSSSRNHFPMSFQPLRFGHPEIPMTALFQFFVQVVQQYVRQ